MPAFLAMQPGARAKAKAVGKSLVFLLLAFIGAILATAVAKTLLGMSLLDLAKGGAATGAVRALLLLGGTVALPSVVVLLLFREPLAFSGWALEGAARHMGRGVATGFTLLAAMAGVMWLFGVVTFRPAVPSASAALAGLGLSALLWLAQAAAEEGLHRGYAFVQGCRALSFWPAALLSAAWFLYGHVGNPGETALGVLAAGLLGLALSYSLWCTGSLWFALGFHAAWNFTQSFIFGFANSGARPPASLLTATLSGTPLLTGGSVGPEASVLLFPALILLGAVLYLDERRQMTGRPPLRR